MMKNWMIAGVIVAGFCGFGIAANAAPADMTGSPSDLPYTVAQLQGSVQNLQLQVNALEGRQGQGSGFPQAVISADEVPNHDDAPIPNGDYPPGW